jgi:hypothetical protein
MRIEQVSKDSGISAEIILLEQVSGSAYKLEKQLKKLGVNPKFTSFNGSTEFRSLTDEELKYAVETIKKWEISR